MVGQQKTMAQMNAIAYRKNKTNGNTYDMFPVGTRVKIIVCCCDFSFWYGETGVVRTNKHSYFGIRVRLDKPRRFEDGHVQRVGAFEPLHLLITEPVPYFPDYQI